MVMQYDIQKKEEEKKKKKKDTEAKRPTNFTVKGFKSEEYDIYDESMANQTNIEILTLLGMDEDELKQEAKLGLKKQEISAKKGGEIGPGDIPIDEQGRYDFLRMGQANMTKCLPMNTERKETDDYVLFDVPPPLKYGKKMEESELVPISSFDEWAQKVFTGVKFLNTIQSKVKKIAFDTDENMLVSAPTGAGKTNIALLTIMHEIDKVIDKTTWKLTKDDIKMIYISPMKALAAEIVDKF
jgi:superfamily II RNA helicase